MKPRPKAWMPVEYGAPEVEALQALKRGEANEHQQRLALDWIINKAAGTYEISFRSDADGGERETAFAEGRRFVGLQSVKMLAMTGKMIAALRSKNG
ncbi:hypothetical protein [Profundibacter sp.]